MLSALYCIFVPVSAKLPDISSLIHSSCLASCDAVSFILGIGYFLRTNVSDQ